MQDMFFDGWDTLLRTAVLGVLAYASVVFLLRITGRRSLSKMNAFDFVVTVALGSTLASVLTSKTVSLAQGALAFFVLIGLQFVVTWLSVRIGWVRNVVTGEPVLLFHRGTYLEQAMKHARVTHQEVRAAMRGDGHAAMNDVYAVVLETDGSFSVLGDPADERSSMQGVIGYSGSTTS